MNADVNLLNLGVLMFAAMFLMGCASTPKDLPEPPAEIVVPMPPPPAIGGSIYASTRGHALFEDNKARFVGDLLTVVLVERTQASASAATNTSKDQDTSIINPTFLGREITAGGTPLFGGSLTGSRDFSGSGASSQSNQLDGQLTVHVVDVLPNGVLRVIGEKRLHLNKANETLRLTGLVRPRDIGPDNTVLSSRIGEARIEYSGDGSIGDSNTMGWLARFFNSKWWPL